MRKTLPLPVFYCIIIAGAPTHAIPECVNHMIETNRISRYGAIEYLDAHNLQGHLAGLVSPQRIVNSLPPSMFYFEDDNQISKQAISINIAFKTYGTPINVLFTQEQRLDPELEILFGDKSYKWVNTAFEMLDRIKLVSTKPERSNLLLTKKLKVLSILLNIVTRNLYRGYPEVVAEFLKALLTADVNILNDAYELTSMKRTSSGFKLESNIPAEPEEIVLRKSSLFKPSIGSLLDKLVQHNAGNRTIEIGLPLLLAIWQVFECRVLQWVGEPLLIAALLSEQRLVMASIFTRVSQPPQMYQILSLMGKRLQTTLFLFCDAVRFESAVTNRTIEYLSHVGRKLEVEQTIIRDLSPSRLARDLQNLSSGVTIDTVADFLSPICNSFLYSLAIDGNISKLQSAESPEFTSLKREFYHKFTPKHEDIKRSEFDVEGLLSASDLFMAYYNVAELQ